MSKCTCEQRDQKARQTSESTFYRACGKLRTSCELRRSDDPELIGELGEELQRYSSELEARAHEKGCAIAAVKREIGDMETMSQTLGKFLSEAGSFWMWTERYGTQSV